MNESHDTRHRSDIREIDRRDKSRTILRGERSGYIIVTLDYEDDHNYFRCSIDPTDICKDFNRGIFSGIYGTSEGYFVLRRVHLEDIGDEKLTYVTCMGRPDLPSIELP